MWMKTSHDQSGRPASRRSTRFDGSSDSRAASAHPADPPPTITKSYRRSVMASPARRQLLLRGLLLGVDEGLLDHRRRHDPLRALHLELRAELGVLDRDHRVSDVP